MARFTSAAVSRGRLEREFEMTREAAMILADVWVSEKNRLRPETDGKGLYGESEKSIIGMFAWVLDVFARRKIKADVVDDLGVPRDVLKKARTAFEHKWWATLHMHDAEQRRVLGETIFAATAGSNASE